MNTKRDLEVNRAVALIRNLLAVFKLTLKIDYYGDEPILCVVDETTGKKYGMVGEIDEKDV